jgi:DNA-binding GntR family transcriptional regulator
MSNAAIKAYHTIRDAIRDGTYQPGTQLREEQLAAEIGVSRTPIRDALRRLLADGLVETRRNYGTFVTDLTPAELLEVFEIRALLEGYAARKAAEQITDEEVAELERLADAMEAIAGSDDERMDSFSRLNREFHLVIARASRSRRLEKMLAQMFEIPLEPLKQYRLHRLININRSNRQHREIIEALRERNPAWAALRLESHLLSTRPMLALRKGEGGAPPPLPTSGRNGAG